MQQRGNLIAHYATILTDISLHQLVNELLRFYNRIHFEHFVSLLTCPLLSSNGS